MKIRKNTSIAKDLETLYELREQYKALDMEITAIENRIKKYMTEHNTEDIENDIHKATYKMVVSRRIDTTALKKQHPKIAEKFTIVAESMRFTFK